MELNMHNKRKKQPNDNNNNNQKKIQIVSHKLSHLSRKFNRVVLISIHRTD